MARARKTALLLGSMASSKCGSSRQLVLAQDDADDEVRCNACVLLYLIELDGDRRSVHGTSAFHRIS